MSDSAAPHPTPEYLEELMSGYVLDALTPEETAEFEQYLRNDLTLIQRTNQMQEIVGLLPHSTQIKAPPELRTKIQKISQATAIAPAQPPQLRPIGQRQSRRSRTLWKLLGAIGALALLILGLDNLRLRYQLATATRQVTTLQASVAEHEEEDYTFELAAKQAGSKALATIVFDADRGVMFVGAKHLPPLPPGEAYHIWAFTKDNQKVLCGRFNIDSSDQVIKQFSVRPEDYTADVAFMRISKEPVVTPPDASRRVLVLTSEM
jgi:anti-sigma-K factor RskA